MISTIEIVLISGFSFLVLTFLGWFIGGYNSLVNLNESLKTQWSNIRAEYRRRIDLFVNLASTVKSSKNYEKETLKEVIALRNHNPIVGDSKSEQAKTMGMLDGLFSKLLAVVENYPDLKAVTQHEKILEEVRITEDRINVARTDYNDIVRQYNIYVRTFPSNILANWFKFKLENFLFKFAKNLTEETPKIELD